MKIFRIVLTIIVALQITVFPFGRAYGQKMEMTPLHAQAVASYREGRYEEAAKLYRQILADDPKNVGLLRDLMWVLWKSEHFQESGEIASLVLKLRPDDSEAKGITEKAPTLALRADANAHYRAGRYESANKLYRKLVDQDPKNTAVLRDLMWSLWETERYDEARETASRILAIRKDDKEAEEMMKRAPMAALRSKAVRSYRAGNYPEAVQSYRALLDQSPNNAGIMKDLYWALWQTGDFVAVTEIATKLTELYPGDVEAWNMLGRIHLASARQEEALKAYQKSLGINPRQPETRRVLGRLQVDLRQFDEALEILGNLEATQPNTPSIYPQMAKAQFFKGRYGESAANWTKAVALYPENESYRVHEARALYYAGQVPLAISKMKKIAAGTGAMKDQAVDFLTDDALASGDYETAAKILSENLTEIQPLDEPRLFKLAMIYQRDEKPNQCLQTLDRYLKSNPNSMPVLLSKADLLNDNGLSKEALRVYQKIQKLNPYCIRAHIGVAYSELALGRPGQAIKACQAALRLDPTDPYLVLFYSHFLVSGGRVKEGQNVLLKWLNKNKGPVLPVLLYHGLTPFKRDPLLAHPVHLQLSVFEDQMRGLKAAGYTPVTSDQVVAWYKKNIPLPKNPILITFDDGRIDSMRYADPILKKYDLKATMFVPIGNIEGLSSPSYILWDQVMDYQSTGRWEFQAHGDKGHSRVVIDAEGRLGLFLVNRRWLAAENRMETIPEWKSRIAGDHEAEKRAMQKRLGKIPQSYAYPEGTYGQTDVVNSPEAAPLNLESTKKYFQVAYIQNAYGINVHSRDPQYLTRLEPKADWSGRELVQYLQDNNPSVVMNRRLLWQATWDGRPRKADVYLKNLKEVGASQMVLLGEEGRIRSSIGEYEGGRYAAENALRLGEDKPTENLLQSIKTKDRASWNPSYTFSEDDRDRSTSIFEQTLKPFPVSKLNLGLLYLYGDFRERNLPSVSQNGAGLSLQGKLSPFHSLGGRAMWHWFPDRSQIDDNYSGSVNFNSNWNDDVQTEFRVGRALYDTVRALTRNVTEDYASANGFWRPESSWQAFGKIQGADVSDGNRRYGIEASLSRALFGDFRGVYKYVFDHMDEMSANYYSPQQLHQHQLGFEFATGSDWVRPSIIYLPGTGKERGSDRQFIQDVQASILFRLGTRTTLQPFFGYLETPTYKRKSYNVQLMHRF